jgi:pyridoxal phosphate enzyme (YggS family)
MDKALSRAGRPPGSVTLIAISKLQPGPRVRAVLEMGHRVFGENRVQEAEARWSEFRGRYDGIVLHLVGPLQSNKVRRAVELFDAIHSVDSERLARRIADAAVEAQRAPAIFVQVNTGREPQKAGIDPDEADALVATCRTLGLPPAGLMCIPPLGQDPVPHFRLLREIASRNGLKGLSMGMSDDFEAAIAEGATHVRIGSALFGARAQEGAPSH